MKMQIKIKKLDQNASLPNYARAWDAGADLTAIESVTIPAGGTAIVGTGIAVEIPPEYVGLVHPRSGMAAKYGVTVLNAPGTIDAGYRGEIKVILINHGKEAYQVAKWDKIAQLVIQEVVEAHFVETDELSDSSRYIDGFGSTGK